MTNQEEITQTCSFCGKTETHTLKGWIGAGWRSNLFLYRFACADPDCRYKLYQADFKMNDEPARIQKYNKKYNVKFPGGKLKE